MESGISIIKRNFLFKFVMFVLILIGLSCFRTSALKVGDAISDKDCLTFTAIDGDATVKFSWSEANKVMCSVDDGDNWFNYDANKEIYLEKGESVKFKGSGVIMGSYHYSFGFKASGGNLSVSGNLNSLRLDENLEKFVGLRDYCFWGILRCCSNLIDASQLILDAEILSYCCYQNMFEKCENLTKAPELPATSLASFCYCGMFQECTNLTEAPELPATSLASHCYALMFEGCKKLTKAPDELPATSLAEGCYENMFAGCNLTKAPKLPATSLAEGCYSYMFNACMSLIEAPELPATSLKYQCYSNMFKRCTSLTNVPALPATTLNDYCYSEMFIGCTNLEFSESMTDKYNKEWTIRTDNGKSGYKTMFDGCAVNWLKNAPENSTVTLYQKEKDNLMASNGLTGSYNNDNKSETLSASSEEQETSSLKEPSDDIDPKYDTQLSNTKSVSSSKLANSQSYESESLANSQNSDSVSSSSLTSNQNSSGSSNAAKSSAIKTGELTANYILLEFFLLMLLSFKRKKFEF